MKEEFINQSLTRILKFATGAHEGQKRKYSDEDYITHPIEVAKRVNHKHVDEQMTAAALLHDVLEDTKVTHLEMRTFLHTVYSVEMAERVLSLVVLSTILYYNIYMI